MDISTFGLYLILKMDALRFLCFVISFLLLVSGIISLIFFGDDAYKKGALRWIKIFFPSFVIALAVGLLLPTTQECAVLYILPKLVGNPNIQDLANNSVGAVNELVKLATEYMKDLIPVKP